MKTVALILAAAAATAVAMCPNQCSGHGACTSDDQCRCWKGYTGFDCSKRSCPVVESWAVDDAENPHAYQTCAGKGLCDHVTGTCTCFAGYEGRGCERSSCPNACSGHGKCRMLADLDTYAAGRKEDPSTWVLSWDEKAILACECDGGFMGPDCSQRICPHGDDPMTVCEQGDTEQVQQLTVTLIAGGAAPDGRKDDVRGDIALRFKSYANEVFYTGSVAEPVPITGDTQMEVDAVADNLEAALEALPNFRVRDVDVTASSPSAGTGEFQVTFKHEDMGANSFGEQNLLMCPHPRKVATDVYTFGCASHGCQPIIKQPRVVALHKANTPSLTDFETPAAITLDQAVDAATKITDDSVLTCPLDDNGDSVSCHTGAEATSYQGSLLVVGVAIDNPEVTAWDHNNNGGADDEPRDVKIYVKGFGGGDVGGAYGADIGTNALDTFTYIGRASDYVTLEDGVTVVNNVDISTVSPDTRLNIHVDDLPFAGAVDVVTAFSIHYNVATCDGVTDITNSATAGFDNLDVENIECSGRGECDRTTGNCACFDGYTGLACGEQTILI